MKVLLLGAGRFGDVPPAHPYLSVVRDRSAPDAALPLPPVLLRERKLLAILRAAQAGLAPIQADTALLASCGMVLATRWDGRLGSVIDETSGQVRSFAELSPITIATSLVPHVAASSVPTLLGIGGPALSIATQDGLAAALAVAAAYLRRGARAMLVQESDLALPAARRDGLGPPADYAISLLVSAHDCDKAILGELSV